MQTKDTVKIYLLFPLALICRTIKDIFLWAMISDESGVGQGGILIDRGGHFCLGMRSPIQFLTRLANRWRCCSIGLIRYVTTHLNKPMQACSVIEAYAYLHSHVVHILYSAILVVYNRLNNFSLDKNSCDLMGISLSVSWKYVKDASLIKFKMLRNSIIETSKARFFGRSVKIFSYKKKLRLLK